MHRSGSDRFRPGNATYGRYMIIEAGYDVAELARYSVMRDDDSRRALWVLCLDEHLRYLNLSKACNVMVSTLEEHVDKASKHQSINSFIMLER